MKRRTFVLTAAAAIAAPAIVNAQAKPEVSKLGIGFGLDPVFAPHIVAMEKGWLREAGFAEIATPSFTSGALAGEALIADQIQLWTPGNLPPISMANSGVPAVVLGTNCIATQAEQLIVRNDANVTTPEDLYKIRIGLLAGSTASATLHILAKHYKLDESKLQIVNMPPPEQLAGLTNNNIQALLCWQPWAHNALRLGNTTMLHSGTTSGFAANKGAKVQVSATRSLFVASESFVRKNPIATRTLMGILVRGQKYVANPANRAEVIDLVAQRTRQDKALVDAIWGDYDFNPAFDDAYVADMDSLGAYLVASGRLRNVRAPLDYTFTDPVAAADPALVKRAGRWKA
jgi:ABC-type nitrate/sulfonate/bicarbonate transport system substrate-binding protein